MRRRREILFRVASAIFIVLASVFTLADMVAEATLMVAWAILAHLFATDLSR